MDSHTFDLLEFDKVRERLAGYAACSLGKELARAVEPMGDFGRIQAELHLVSEMVEALAAGHLPPFGGLHDVRLTVRRAQIGAMLTAEQLLEIADTLTCTGAMYRYRMRLDAGLTKLIELLSPIEDLGLVAKSIGGCIDGRGQVLDSASPELARVRRQLAELDERVQGQIKKLLRDPELRRVLRYPNATVSGDHYVLPVAVNYRHLLHGVVHRTSSTGETLFIEPAGIAHLSAERSMLKTDEDREIKRILRMLSAEVAKVARPLTVALDAMARLDFITAKAKFSRDLNMSAPDLNRDGKLWLRQARHPLLELLLRGQDRGQGSGVGGQGSGVRNQGSGVRGQESGVRGQGRGVADQYHQPTNLAGSSLTPEPRPLTPTSVVPIDVRLGHEFNLLVITGPNTGGKTVTLKTTGLLCVMALAGLHIPAGQGSAVPLLTDVLADIGDEQSLEQSLSTFSSHMSRIASILERAGANSLVLLDELGAGTDPTEGAALGRAILDALDRSGCRAMVTTHLGDLKTYAFGNDRAENAAVEFDVESLRPTYRLLIGQFGQSNALKIARRLKLPRELLRRAHRYLRRKQRRAPELQQLQELRAEAERARTAALAAEHDAQRQREEYESRIDELNRKAEEAAELRAARERLRPGDRVRVERFDQPGRLVRIDHVKRLALVSVGLGQWEVPLDELFPWVDPAQK
jgi:DNA mismatch repair protein MutS2